MLLVLGIRLNITSSKWEQNIIYVYNFYHNIGFEVLASTTRERKERKKKRKKVWEEEEGKIQSGEGDRRKGEGEGILIGKEEVKLSLFNDCKCIKP